MKQLTKQRDNRDVDNKAWGILLEVGSNPAPPAGATSSGIGQVKEAKKKTEVSVLQSQVPARFPELFAV